MAPDAAPSRERRLSPGQKLGQFQLLLPIGAGGMGSVWVARDPNSAGAARLVAIKTSLSDEDGGREYWNVLLDEARIASQLHHPNVCAIHAFEVDEQTNTPYLVMEYSDGGSLHELLAECAEHRIEPLLAARIGMQICDGLEVAHELSDEHGVPLGVVHRDVSPQNILISSSGQVRLTDFGVAKARGRLHAATETGEVKGKLSYMAPEQVTSKTADRRADVFALGCVLYEATTGERPFHGDDAVTTLYQLLERPLEPPSQRLAGYPAELEPIVLKALARDPAGRYQTAQELGSALNAWIVSQGILVTERELATLVREALGSRIAERQQRIGAVEKNLDTGSPLVPSGEQTLSGSARARPAEVPPARRSSALPLGAAVVAALALGAFVVFGSARRSAAPPSSEPSAAIASVLPTASAVGGPAQITLILRAEPAQAALYLDDDGAALPNPYRLVARADGSSHRLRAVAPGFAERSEPLSYDQSKEVLVALSALPASAAPRPPHAKGATPPAASAKPGGDLPAVVRKTRKIDTDNPFAGQ